MNDGRAAGVVVIILALGLTIALDLITLTIYVAVANAQMGVLGENTTQILMGWGGGIISVLAGFCGYIIGKKEERGQRPDQS